jgi:hypothetical protein
MRLCGCLSLDCNASAVASDHAEASVNMCGMRQRQQGQPTTTHGMDGDHGPFDVPDFWRTSAFGLSDTLGQTLFTDTHFGEFGASPVTCRLILMTTQNCP